MISHSNSLCTTVLYLLYVRRLPVCMLQKKTEFELSGFFYFSFCLFKFISPVEIEEAGTWFSSFRFLRFLNAIGMHSTNFYSFALLRFACIVCSCRLYVFREDFILCFFFFRHLFRWLWIYQSQIKSQQIQTHFFIIEKRRKQKRFYFVGNDQWKQRSWLTPSSGSSFSSNSTRLRTNLLVAWFSLRFLFIE